MKITILKRDLAGMLTLPISGVFALIALTMRGPLGNPLNGIDEWAKTTSSGIYLITQITMIVAYVLPFYGLCSLYVYLAKNDRVEQMAFIGLVTSLMGTALALPASGIWAFAAPVAGRLFLQDQLNVSQMFIDSITGPGLAIGIAAAILYTLGPIYLGLAVWRCTSLPKWAGVCFALHGVLLSFGFSYFPVLILGWVVFTLSGGWITRSLLQQQLTATE